MKRLAAFSIVLLVFSSCKKITHADTIIQGQVINQTDNSPLVGYKVHLIETETPPKPFSPLIITTLDTKITDTNGRFDFGDWDLNKRSRFDYTVQLDIRGEDFVSQAWQEGGYSRVSQEEQIEKGKFNDLILKQVKFGNVKFIIENNTAMNPLDFNMLLQNDLFENRSGSFSVDAGDHFIDETPSAFASGNAEVICTISNPNSSFTETITQSIVIPHNDTVTVFISYP